jgi:hypothetical protein
MAGQARIGVGQPCLDLDVECHATKHDHAIDPARPRLSVSLRIEAAGL